MTERLSVGIVGCGDLGTALGEQLVDAGHNVVGIRRRSEQLPESFASRQILRRRMAGKTF